MVQIDRFIAQQIRAHRKAGILPIYRLMPISKCWIGYPTQRYVIWWGKKILAHCATNNEAIKKRREIYEMA